MNNEIILRPNYINQFKDFIDKPFIKVITGMRRSGKSELLKMIRDEIIARGVDENHILFINFEELWTLELSDNIKFANYILKQMVDDEKYYLFFDEVQNVEGWEKVINGLRLKNTDLYITGSNSKLLSGELSTLLGGRCLMFSIYTLSYDEFLKFRSWQNEHLLKLKKSETTIYDYINYGGFPVISKYPYTLENAHKIVEDIFNTALYKDVVQRNNIRNNDLLKSIVAFLFDNVGNLTSFKSITNALKAGGISADVETVSNYVSYLEDAFIVHCAKPYDIKGKQLLASNRKYYLGDHSLQYSVRKIRSDKIQGVLENIVFMDLKRRGYDVYVGRIGNKEIDFVAEKSNKDEKIYVQVCLEFSSNDVINREFAPLKDINDNYPKYVVNMDRFSPDYIEEGIVAISLDKFLMRERL